MFYKLIIKFIGNKSDSKGLDYLKIVNNSEKYAHLVPILHAAPDESHFKIIIVSNSFEGVDRK